MIKNLTTRLSPRLSTNLAPTTKNNQNNSCLNFSSSSNFSNLNDQSNHQDLNHSFQPSTSSSSSSSASIPSSSSSKNRKIRLREKAGLRIFGEEGNFRNQDFLNNQTEEGEEGEDEDVLYSSSSRFKPIRPLSKIRVRNQAERFRMSYSEKVLALDLLEDLNVPTEELTNQIDPSIPQTSFRGNGLPSFSDQKTNSQKDESFRSMINQLSRSLSIKDDLIRNRYSKKFYNEAALYPTQEEIQKEDLVKELVDSHIKLIDEFNNDYDLLSWIDQNLLDHNSNRSDEELDRGYNCSSDKNLVTVKEIEISSRLGEVFESKTNEEEEAEVQLIDERAFSTTNDQENILNKKLCYGPLLNPILIHLLQTFSTKFKNPNLSLYLFNRIKSHPDHRIRYFGLNNNNNNRNYYNHNDNDDLDGSNGNVYLTVIKIRWKFFRDLRGIKDDLIEMRKFGVEIDENLKRLIRSIVDRFVKDEIEVENLNTSRFDQDSHSSDHEKDDAFVEEGKELTQKNGISKVSDGFVGFQSSWIRKYSDLDRKNLKFIENICF